MTLVNAFAKLAISSRCACKTLYSCLFDACSHRAGSGAFTEGFRLLKRYLLENPPNGPHELSRREASGITLISSLGKEHHIRGVFTLEELRGSQKARKPPPQKAPRHPSLRPIDKRGNRPPGLSVFGTLAFATLDH